MVSHVIQTPKEGTIKVVWVWPDGSYGVHTMPMEVEGDETAVQINNLLPLSDSQDGEPFGSWSQVEGR